MRKNTIFTIATLHFEEFLNCSLHNFLSFKTTLLFKQIFMTKEYKKCIIKTFPMAVLSILSAKKLSTKSIIKCYLKTQYI